MVTAHQSVTQADEQWEKGKRKGSRERKTNACLSSSSALLSSNKVNK